MLYKDFIATFGKGKRAYLAHDPVCGYPNRCSRRNDKVYAFMLIDLKGDGVIGGAEAHSQIPSFYGAMTGQVRYPGGKPVQHLFQLHLTCQEGLYSLYILSEAICPHLPLRPVGRTCPHHGRSFPRGYSR
jgi:hypothetical protein